MLVLGHVAVPSPGISLVGITVMMKLLSLAAVASLALTGGASAFIEYDCGVRDGFAVIVTLFDEEDVVRANITLLSSGQM